MQLITNLLLPINSLLKAFYAQQQSTRQHKSRKPLGQGSSKVADQGEAIIRFSDVAGVDEAKEELEEIVVQSSFFG